MKTLRLFSSAAALAASLTLSILAPMTVRAEEKPFLETVKPYLVHMEDNALRPPNDAALSKIKYLAVYYSAHWCPPCRQFTPELVNFYNEVKPNHPEFDLVFVSDDNSEQEMHQYITEDKMPWLAVRYQFAKMKPAQQYSGSGIPDLVFIDASSGKVLSDSFKGEDYLGPHKVLGDIRKTLGAGS